MNTAVKYAVSAKSLRDTLQNQRSNPKETFFLYSFLLLLNIDVCNNEFQDEHL